MDYKAGFRCLVCWFVMTCVPYTDGIECYSCTNQTALCNCRLTTKCPNDNAICFSEYTLTSSGKLYTLGCRDPTACPQTGSGTGSIIGRSLHPNCSQCCDTSNCNRRLCQEPDPSCADTNDFDCITIGSTVNYCLDPQHAKTYCKHFCGLCTLAQPWTTPATCGLSLFNVNMTFVLHVIYICACRGGFCRLVDDGGWASWSAWSACDVSCSNGTQTRSRTCTNPTPKDCGENCVGNSLTTKSCAMPLCPVHGGWSPWSHWGSCSVTCDVGQIRRDRSCSNPFPSRTGDHCFGTGLEEKLCFMPGCHDGQWGSWSSWSQCSRTCGDGLRSRARDCVNPAPSLTGRDCAGIPLATEMCTVRHCPVKMSAFTVKNPKILSSNVIVFQTYVFNQGSTYNTHTGIFTCQYPGLYFFTADLIDPYSSSPKVGLVYAYIKKNDVVVIHIYNDPYHDSTDVGSYEATGSVIQHLNKGDTIKVQTEKAANTLYDYSRFSGYLIQPDN